MRKNIVVVVILLLTGVVTWLASRPDTAPQQMPDMVRFDVDAVAAISLITGMGREIQLSWSDDRWKLSTGEVADGDAVLHLLNDLATMRAVRVVTRNPGHYEKLYVGSRQASRVILSDAAGKKLLDLFVGKQGTDLVSTYLRLADTPEVFAVDRALLWQVKRSPQGWKAAVETGGKQ